MADSLPPNAFTTETLAQYTPRAAAYDTAAGGWHAELGHDFVTWLPPPKGGADPRSRLRDRARVPPIR